MNNKKNKIGILGGTFNPIHIGHLIMAQSAYEVFGLDKIWIMPTANPPHKQEQHITDKEVRAKMVELAIADNPHFVLSREELDYEGLGYTAETLVRLKEKNPDHEYHFILGADSLFSFEYWKNPGKICENCKILAATRNQQEREALEQKIKELQRKFSGDFLILDNPTLEISSQDIRNRIPEGRSIRYLVPERIERFIFEHDLYKVGESV